MTTPTAERVAILQGGKVTIGRQVDATTARSVDAYVRAWVSTRQDLVAAAAEAHRVAAATGNERSAAAYRTARLNKVLAELTAQLQRLGMRTGVQVTDVVPDVMAVPAQVLEALDPGGLGGLNRVPARELEAIIRRQQEVIASKYLVLSVEAEQSMRDALLRGVARGSGTDAVARDMVRTAQAGAARRLGIGSAAELDAAPAAIVDEVRAAFAGGMQRAQVLARTELIDASRVATTATYLAAPGVVAGWEWMATLDARTCGACWAMHGRVFAPDVHLEGHQQCRCVQSPLLHGERPGENGLQDADAAFARLTRQQQIQVLGPKRLELVEQGRATLGDMATRRDNPGWRAGHYVTPLDQLGGQGPRRAPAPLLPPAPPRPAAPVAPPRISDRVPIPDSVHDALTPRRGGWDQRTTRQRTVAELKQTPEGKVLAKTLDSFQSGGATAIPRLRTDIEKHLAGGADLDPGRVESVETLLAAIGRHDAGARPLYRGMTIPGDTASVLARYQPGTDVNLSLASFSSDKGLARTFASSGGAGQRVKGAVQTPVLVEWVGEAKRALPVENMSKSRIFAEEREWLGAGRYVVDGVKTTKAGGVETVHVTMRQVGTW